MFICQPCFANTSSQLPSRFDTTRGMTAQLVVHLLAKLADTAVVGFPKHPPVWRATIASSVVPGDQPSNVSDQPHDLQDVSATDDNRFQFPEPTCSPQRSHGKPEYKLRRVPGFDDCEVVRVLAKFDVLWHLQLTAPAISSPAHHPRAIQHLYDLTSPASVPQHQLSPQKNPSLTALPSQHH